MIKDDVLISAVTLKYCTCTNVKGKHTEGRSEGQSHSLVSDPLRPQGLYSPWTSPGQNTGVGSLSLLQGIFPTQGSNPGLPHCGWILYQLSHKASKENTLQKATSLVQGFYPTLSGILQQTGEAYATVLRIKLLNA